MKMSLSAHGLFLRKILIRVSESENIVITYPGYMSLKRGEISGFCQTDTYVEKKIIAGYLHVLEQAGKRGNVGVVEWEQLSDSRVLELAT